LHTAVQEHEEKKAESNKLYIVATKEIATQKQKIAQLNSKISDLEAANSMLTRSHQMAKRELEIAARNHHQASQFCVELRMQGLDFKSEVERRTAKMLSSVQTRLGFVPTCIQKHAQQLRILKPPGDPHYEEVRAGSHMRTKLKRNKAKRAASLTSGSSSSPSVVDDDLTPAQIKSKLEDDQNPGDDYLSLSSSFVPWASASLKAAPSPKSSSGQKLDLSSLNLSRTIDSDRSQSRSVDASNVGAGSGIWNNGKHSQEPPEGIAFRNSSATASDESVVNINQEESEIIIDDDQSANELGNTSAPRESTRSQHRRPLETNDDWVHWALSDAQINDKEFILNNSSQAGAGDAFERKIFQDDASLNVPRQFGRAAPGRYSSSGDTV
jgi:hypothetical protein